MKFKRVFIPAVVLSLLAVTDVGAQQRRLCIDEMFSLAEENSKSIRSFQSGADAAQQAVAAAKTDRLPDINLSLSACYLGDVYMTDRDYSNGKSYDMPHFGNNFALTVSQLIYSGGALPAGIKLSELAQQIALLDTEKNRQDIRFLLLGFYLDLYKLCNQSEVYKRNIDLTGMLISNIQAKQQQGTALSNDITRYELQLEMMKLGLTKVENTRKILNHQIITTLGLPVSTIIEPDTTILQADYLTGSEADWQSQASSSSAVLQQASCSVEMALQKEKIEKAALLPHIALFAEDHFDGPLTFEVPTLDMNLNYWLIGVGVKYNISSLYRNNRKVRQARFETQRSRQQYELAKQHIENAVQADFIRFLESFTELQTQQKSLELASRNYNVTNNRYLNELALVTDMVDASNQQLSAELQLVNARINVVYNYYKMKYTTGTL